MTEHLIDPGGDTPMRAIIYTRTATVTGDNVRRQLERCQTFAASRGWDVREVFTDDGASGWSMDRPGLMQAVQQVRSRRCDALIAERASVLTRRASGFASITSDADASGVVLATADGALDTSKARGKFAARVLATFAGWAESSESARVASAD